MMMVLGSCDWDVLPYSFQDLQQQVQRSMDARARADERSKQLAAEKAELEVRFALPPPPCLFLLITPTPHSLFSLPPNTGTFIIFPLTFGCPFIHLLG